MFVLHSRNSQVWQKRESAAGVENYSNPLTTSWTTVTKRTILAVAETLLIVPSQLAEKGSRRLIACFSIRQNAEERCNLLSYGQLKPLPCLIEGCASYEGLISQHDEPCRKLALKDDNSTPWLSKGFCSAQYWLDLNGLYRWIWTWPKPSSFAPAHKNGRKVF